MRVALLLAALVSAGALAAPPEDAPLEDLGDRLRFGLSAGIGTIIPLRTLLVEGEARFGYQVTSRFSAFAVGGGTWGTSSNTYLAFVGGIVEYLPVDFLSVGGGVVFGYGRVAGFNPDRPSFEEGPTFISEPDAAGFSGTFKPGLDLRVGWNTARGRPPGFRRLGLTFGFDLKMFFHTDLKLLWGPGLGTVTNQSILTFAPMVVVGFDSR